MLRSLAFLGTLMNKNKANCAICSTYLWKFLEEAKKHPEMKLDAVWQDRVWELNDQSTWLGEAAAQSGLGAPATTCIYAGEGEQCTHVLYTPHWSYISAAWPRIVNLLLVRSLVIECTNIKFTIRGQADVRPMRRVQHMGTLLSLPCMNACRRWSAQGALYNALPSQAECSFTSQTVSFHTASNSIPGFFLASSRNFHRYVLQIAQLALLSFTNVPRKVKVCNTQGCHAV